MADAVFRLLKCIGTLAVNEVDISKYPSFLSADATTNLTASFPVSVPAVGGDPNFSYEVFLRLECTTAPSNAVTNIRFYGANVAPAASVEIYAGASPTVSTPISSVLSSIAASLQHVYFYNSNPNNLSISASTASGSIENVGEKTHYIVLQLKTLPQAGRGTSAILPMNITYTET